MLEGFLTLFTLNIIKESALLISLNGNTNLADTVDPLKEQLIDDIAPRAVQNGTTAVKSICEGN